MIAAATTPEIRRLRRRVEVLSSGLDLYARRQRAGVWLVPSMSQANQRYTVSRDARGEWRCTCVAGQFGRPCRHVDAVLARLERGEA